MKNISTNSHQLVRGRAILLAITCIFSVPAFGDSEETRRNIRRLADQISDLSFQSSLDSELLIEAELQLRQVRSLLDSASSRIVLENVLDVSISSERQWVVKTDGSVLFRDGVESFRQIPGSAVTIKAVDNGHVLAIDRSNRIMEWDGSNWRQRAGLGIDVAGNAKGDVCLIGTNRQPHCYTPQGGLIGMVGLGLRIDLQSSGQIWMVGTNNRLYHWQNNRWFEPNGHFIMLNDIIVGPNDELYGIDLSSNVVKIDAFNGTTTILDSGTRAAAITSRGQVFSVTPEFNLLSPKPLVLFE